VAVEVGGRGVTLLCLDGALAKAEPKTLRYRLLHTAARIIRANANARSKSRDLTWAGPLAACLLAAFALQPPAR
jgi:hypothetical protein